MKIKSIIKSVVLLKLLRWFVTIILLVPISLYIISFLISDEQLFTWLVDRVQIETNTTMSYSSDVHFSRGMTPELQVNNLNLTENNHGYTARVSSLRVQLDLFELLKGRVNIPILEVGDVKVVINSSSDDSKEDNTSLPEILFDLSRLQIIPVIHQANFGKITVEFEGKNWQHDVNQISKLKLNINATRQILIFTADVKVEKQQLHIDVFLPDLSQSLKNRKLPFSFKVDGRFITAEIAGDIDLQSNQPTIKAFYNATIQDLTHIPLNNALELPGNIVLKGKVEGSLSEPVLNDIQVTWDTLRSGKMSLIGKIGNITAGNQIDLSLTGALPELPESQWLQKHLPEYLPIDNVKVNTQISGSFEHLIFHELAINAKANVKTKEPLDLGLNGSVHLVKSGDAMYQLEKISLLATHSDGISIAVSGDIHSLPLDTNMPILGLALDVDIKVDETALITQSIELGSPVKGPMNINFSISGDAPALLFHNIALEAGQKEALIINANGLLQFGDWAKDDPLEVIEMSIQINSRTTADFVQLIQSPTLPELGPLALNAIIKTTNGQHAIKQILLKTDKNRAITIDITGGVNRLSFLPNLAVDGIHLKAQTKGKDITKLIQLFGVDPKSAPALGSFALSSELSGSHKKLLINNTKITIGKKKNLQITGNGQIGKLDAQSGWKLYDTDLFVKVVSKNIQQGLKSFNQQIPDLGSLKGSARIQGNQEKFKLHSLNLKIGKTRHPIAIARGSIQDLLNTKGINIKVDLAFDENSLGKQIKHAVLKDLKPLTGYARITDPNGVPGIQVLKLGSVQKNLEVKIDGYFPDFKQPESLTLWATIDASNLAVLGEMLGYSWPKQGPLKLTTEIRHDGKIIRIKSLFNVANKSLETELDANFSSVRPKISGRFKAKEVTFSEFYQIIKELDKEEAKTKDTQQTVIFSRKPIDFDWLKQLDLDLALDIKSFDSDISTAESAELQIKLKSGHLQISPAVFKFTKGHLDMELSLNSKVKPEINFKAFGKNIDPWLAISNSKGKESLIADLDVDIELHAQGASPHDLVSSLNGELYVTVKNAKMKREYMELLFIDLVGWSTSKVTDSQFYDLNCGVIDSSLEKGVISTRGFILDTNKIVITGDGQINLAKEQINYVLIPKKKSRIILNAEPVKLKGPLADPSIQVIPVKSATLTFGTLVFAPYVFVGFSVSDFLMSIMGKFRTKDPCAMYEKVHVMPEIDR
ncbi:MAG: AsmA family protein [Gammaproteobacteria bacterium]|nr:AsmA family protein [Gammaproteobacteria bacterium]